MAGLTRRDFLVQGGIALGAVVALPDLLTACGTPAVTTPSGLWTNLADVVAKAKQEGTLTYFYVDPVNGKKFTDGFVSDYPWAKISNFSAGLPDMKTKWITEFQANVGDADVMGTVGAFVGPLEQAKSLTAVALPNDGLLLPGLKDPGNFIHPMFIVPQILAYNKNLTQAPANDLFQLADPKYKNMLVMDNPSGGLSGGLILASRRKLWGEAKWMQWLEGLAANKPFFASDPAASMDAVTRGERPLGFGNGGPILSEGLDKALPLVPVFYDDFLVTSLVSVVSAKAPHPHMAALFVNWTQSDNGQKVISATGFSPSTTADTPNSMAKLLPSGAKLLPSAGPTSLLDYFANTADYNQIFQKFWPAA
jgi:iron(III) transport system substrate-binding protein